MTLTTSDVLEKVRQFESVKTLPSNRLELPHQEVLVLVARLRSRLESKLASKCLQVPDDEFLQLTLYTWNYDVAESFRILQNFCRFRNEAGWPYRLSARSLEGALRSNVHWLLDGYDRNGRGILVLNARFLGSASGFSMATLQMMGACLVEIAVRRQAVRDNGLVMLYDMQQTGLGLLAEFSMQDLLRGVSMFKDAFPCKIKRIFLTNVPAVFSWSIRVAKTLLSADMAERIVLVEGLQEISSEIDEQQLPSTLGGKLEVQWGERVDQLVAAEEEDGGQEE